MVLVSPGTSQNTNVGVITLKQTTNTLSQINAGIGKSQSTIYTVPNGYTLFLDQVEVNSSNSYTSATILTYKVQTINNTNGVKLVVLQQPFVAIYTITRPTDPFVYSGKTDIQWLLNTSTGAVAAGVIVIGKLIKNDSQTA